MGGSSSVNEAILVAIGDELHNAEGLAPPDLRASYIEILAQLTALSVRSGVPYSGSAAATVFTRDGGDELWFDETTAQLVNPDGAPQYQVVDALLPQVVDRTTCPRGSD